MKIKQAIRYTKEYEVPEGDYCQGADGSVKCPHFSVSTDPTFGVTFYCTAFDTPFFSKELTVPPKIKKCDKCRMLCEIASRSASASAVNIAVTVSESNFTAHATCVCCGADISSGTGYSGEAAVSQCKTSLPNYCSNCGSALTELHNIPFRENALHTPKIEKVKGTTEVKLYCSVCGTELEDFFNCTDDSDETIINSRTPDYCPKCGARLKESKEFK